MSPSDVLKACALWETMQAPLRLHRFESSGVLAVMSSSFDLDKVCAERGQIVSHAIQVNKALVHLAHERSDGIGVIDAARLVGMAPPIAREQLLAAEAQGALCRDEAPDGLRFFANRFVE